MARKPNRLAVLNSYSLDELLDLIVKKSRIELEQQNQELQDQNSALSKMVGDEVYVPGKRKRGRPKGSTNKSTKAKAKAAKGAKRRGRPPKTSSEKRIPLRQHILKVLRKRAMSVDQIMDALFANGFSSKASDPKRVVYIELKKLSDNGEISKPARGKYAK